MDKIKIGFIHKVDEKNPKQTNVIFERITIRKKPMKGWENPTYLELGRMTFEEWNRVGGTKSEQANLESWQSNYLKKLEAKYITK